MQIWHALPNFDETAALGTWAFRIALNTSISWRRRSQRKKRKSPEHRHSPGVLVGESNSTDEQKLLLQFVTTLSEVDRVVLIMFLEDSSYDEIATAIGVSNGAVRVRLSRIKSRLETWEVDDA